VKIYAFVTFKRKERSKKKIYRVGGVAKVPD
jgi:hypothetical protein